MYNSILNRIAELEKTKDDARVIIKYKDGRTIKGKGILLFKAIDEQNKKCWSDVITDIKITGDNNPPIYQMVAKLLTDKSSYKTKSEV